MTTLLAPHRPTQRRRLASPWKGLWLMAVAVVHTIFAAVVFEPQLREIARLGVFNSVGTDPMAGAVAWFVLFGGVFALLGWAILRIERSAAPDPGSLRGLGVGLLALTLLGIALMPSSGFWLVLPPALALCWSPR